MIHKQPGTFAESISFILEERAHISTTIEYISAHTTRARARARIVLWQYDLTQSMCTAS